MRLNVHPFESAILLLAALVGGIINAVAGGGSFVTLPALLFFSLPPAVANATSAVAAWPGLMTAAYGYRRQLLSNPAKLIRYAATSLIGGVTGGALLLSTPSAAFTRAIPVLMFVATIMYLVSPRLLALTRRHSGMAHGSEEHVTRGTTVIQFFASLMVGYFNAGSGIIVMAGLSLCGIRETQLLNGFKNLLGAIAAGASIAALAVGGQVAWASASLMMVGSLIGGLAGARVAQRIDAKMLRILILAFSFCMTGYFFWKFWI